MKRTLKGVCFHFALILLNLNCCRNYMKLFLTSAGITPEITDEFLKLLAKLSKDCRMVFVPTVPAPRK